MRGAQRLNFRPFLITDAKQVSSVVEKFRAQIWDQRREEVLFKVRCRRSRSDARNAIMMETR